jgi:hypothetical protein
MQKLHRSLFPGNKENIRKPNDSSQDKPTNSAKQPQPLLGGSTAQNLHMHNSHSDEEDDDYDNDPWDMDASSQTLKKKDKSHESVKAAQPIFTPTINNAA